MWNFIVYTSSRIVLEVAHDLLDKGYCLYLDNLATYAPEKQILLEPGGSI